MNWEDKVQMAEHLNNGRYEDAINLFISKEPDLQASDILITGIDIFKSIELFKEHKEFFTKEFIETLITQLNIRSAMRWTLVYRELGYQEGVEE